MNKKSVPHQIWGTLSGFTFYILVENLKIYIFNELLLNILFIRDNN